MVCFYNNLVLTLNLPPIHLLDCAEVEIKVANGCSGTDPSPSVTPSPTPSPVKAQTMSPVPDGGTGDTTTSTSSTSTSVITTTAATTTTSNNSNLQCTETDPAPENCPHCLNIGGTEARCGKVGKLLQLLVLCNCTQCIIIICNCTII